MLKTEINPQGELIITIESSKAGTTCRRCGRWIDKLHGHDDWESLRHLPVFGRPSYLRYRPRRYQCLECEGHPTTTQRLDWHDSRSQHTFAYDEHLLLELIGSPCQRQLDLLMATIRNAHLNGTPGWCGGGCLACDSAGQTTTKSIFIRSFVIGFVGRLLGRRALSPPAVLGLRQYTTTDEK